MNKICTDIGQSQKLIELGIDVNTADMMWDDWSLIEEGWKLSIGYYSEIEKDYGRKCYPAWSLAALLDILPKKYYPVKDHETNLILGKPKDKWCVLYWDTTGMQHGEETLADNPIDACYEMIIKLNEQKLL
ncbi:hypothetical protein J6O48_14125 [bacterium]|nr:hypothetical protein [bacterium]